MASVLRQGKLLTSFALTSSRLDDFADIVMIIFFFLRGGGRGGGTGQFRRQASTPRKSPASCCGNRR